VKGSRQNDLLFCVWKFRFCQVSKVVNARKVYLLERKRHVTLKWSLKRELEANEKHKADLLALASFYDVET
jgi:hypothetical protein